MFVGQHRKLSEVSHHSLVLNRLFLIEYNTHQRHGQNWYEYHEKEYLSHKRCIRCQQYSTYIRVDCRSSVPLSKAIVHLSLLPVICLKCICEVQAVEKSNG